MRFFSIICLLFVMGVPVSAEACSLKRVRGADAAIVPGKIDAALMSKAILAYTNQARCKAGRSTLKYDSALTQAADMHSVWMASARKMTHVSTIRRQRDLGTRLKLTRAKIRVTAAENIGRLSRMAFPSNASFRIQNASSCQFATSAGKVIPPHSYDSLAREIVRLWMASPGHKRNIMINQVKRHGAMVGFDPRAKNCGDYFVTQVFAG